MIWSGSSAQGRPSPETALAHQNVPRDGSRVGSDQETVDAHGPGLAPDELNGGRDGERARRDVERRGQVLEDAVLEGRRDGGTDVRLVIGFGLRTRREDRGRQVGRAPSRARSTGVGARGDETDTIVEDVAEVGRLGRERRRRADFAVELGAAEEGKEREGEGEEGEW